MDLDRSMFDYISGPSGMKYFKDLWARPTTRIDPDDEPEVQLSKLRRRVTLLLRVKAVRQTEGFKVIEEVLLMKAREFDNDVWTAILEGNNDKATSMAIERTGIVTLFESFHEVDDQINASRKLMRQLQGQEEGDDPLGDINIEDLNDQAE